MCCMQSFDAATEMAIPSVSCFTYCLLSQLFCLGYTIHTLTVLIVSSTTSDLYLDIGIYTYNNAGMTKHS